ncbi:MAG: hypothetical protein ACE5FL_10050 [Myxococcota bacterium]
MTDPDSNPQPHETTISCLSRIVRAEDAGAPAAARAWLRTAGLFAASAVVLFLRRPDAFSRAQFYAEDGKSWYAQAYHLGAVAPFLMPQDGYFQTLPRIAALVAQALPLAHAPLCMNLFGLVVQIAPILLLLSPRFDGVLPSARLRLLLSLFYALQPNGAEMHVTITMAGWRLALLALMVIVADAPRTRAGTVYDVCVLALSAISGPFAILLAPAAAVSWAHKRDARGLRVVAILAAGAGLQGVSFLFVESGRPSAPLEPSLSAFVRIIGGQLGIGALLGDRGYTWLQQTVRLPVSLLSLLTLGVGGVFAAAIVRGPRALRVLAVYSLLILSAALISPTASRTQPQWDLLSLPRIAARYWFVPSICLVVSLGWIFRSQRRRVVRITVAACLASLAVGVVWNARRLPYRDLGFAARAARFERATAGSVHRFPIPPARWFMELKKR